MNSTNLSDLYSLCATGLYLSQNGWLLFLNLFRIFLAVAGIVLFIVLFRVQGTQLAFHQNAKVLLISQHIWAMLYCFSTIAWHCFDVIRFGTAHPDDPCKYLISQETSALFRAPGSFAIFGNSLAILSMVIERLVATFFFRKYEKQGTILGWILVGGQWAVALLSITMLILPLDWTEVKVQVSLASAKTSSATYSSLVIMALIELLTIVTFHLLLCYNRRLKRKHLCSTLTERYQIDENIRSVRLMIPMMWTHACCFLPTLIAFPTYIKLNPGLDPRDYTIFTAAFNFIAFYGPLLPIVLFWRHKNLRENLWKTIGISHNNSVGPDGRTEEQILHFEMLKGWWSLSND